MITSVQVRKQGEAKRMWKNRVKFERSSENPNDGKVNYVSIHYLHMKDIEVLSENKVLRICRRRAREPVPKGIEYIKRQMVLRKSKKQKQRNIPKDAY